MLSTRLRNTFAPCLALPYLLARYLNTENTPHIRKNCRVKTTGRTGELKSTRKSASQATSARQGEMKKSSIQTVYRNFLSTSRHTLDGVCSADKKKRANKKCKDGLISLCEWNGSRQNPEWRLHYVHPHNEIS